MLTEQQKKIAKLKDKSDIFLLKEIERVESKLESKLENVKLALPELIEFKAKGQKGDDGKKPVRNIDFFDGKDGDDGYTPIKGKDYFDGKDGYTPVKNVDYFDGEDGETYLLTDIDRKKIASLVPVLEIPDLDIKEVKTGIEKLTGEEKLDVLKLKNLDKLELDAKQIKNLPTSSVIRGGGTSEILSNGDKVLSSHRLNFGAGLTVTNENGTAKIEATGGGGGGGGGEATSISVTQVAHGLSVGNVLKKVGASYALAQADTAANAEVVGIVSVVTDVDTFTLLTGGSITTLTGLTANETYFLSATVAGAFTITEPTTIGEISKPIFNSVSTTEAVFNNMRGNIVVPNDGIDLTLQAEWTVNTVLDSTHNTATIFTEGYTTTIDPDTETYQSNFEAFLDNTGSATGASIVCTASAGYTYRVNGATPVASGTFTLPAGKLCYIMRKLATNLIIINGDV